jgi:hypothetical protein
MRLGQHSQGSSQARTSAPRLGAAGPVIDEGLIGLQKLG